MRLRGKSANSAISRWKCEKRLETSFETAYEIFFAESIFLWSVEMSISRRKCEKFVETVYERDYEKAHEVFSETCPQIDGSRREELSNKPLVSVGL